MKEYFQVAIDQHIERAVQLLAKIDDSELPQEYFVLAGKCRAEIVKAKKELEELRDKSELQHPALQTVRLRRFRRAVDLLSKQETTGVAALSRRHEDDIFLTRLVQTIRQEIKYPFLPPTVTGLSTNYFYIHNDIQLMFVPLSEGNYLLHLPDLYHELAHPLLYDTHSPRVEVLQRAADTVLMEVTSYLDSEMKFEERRQGPEEFRVYLYLWERSWWRWVIEFFCDLFAIYTLGPAFAWSHLHLCIKNEHDPFHVPTRSSSSHPADDARMQVMLLGLEKVGFAQETTDLKKRWQQYLKVSEAKRDSNYKRCFPEHLLKRIVDLAYEGTVDTRCRIVTPNVNDPIHMAFNEAWQQFWLHPHTYIQWEKRKINELKALCGVLVEEAK